MGILVYCAAYVFLTRFECALLLCRHLPLEMAEAGREKDRLISRRREIFDLNQFPICKIDL